MPYIHDHRIPSGARCALCAFLLFAASWSVLAQTQLSLEKALSRIQELQSQKAGINKGQFEKTKDFEKRKLSTELKIEREIVQLVKKDFLTNGQVKHLNYNPDRELLHVSITTAGARGIDLGYGDIELPPAEAKMLVENSSKAKVSGMYWIEDDGSIHRRGRATIQFGKKKYITEPGPDGIKVVRSVRIGGSARSDDACWGLQFSPDKNFLLAWGKDGVVFWNVSTGQQERKLETGYTGDLAFTPNGKLMSVLEYDEAKGLNKLVLFDTENYSPTTEAEITDIRYSRGTLIASNDGKQLAFDSEKDAVAKVFYDVERRTQVNLERDRDDFAEPRYTARDGNWQVKFGAGIYNIPVSIEIVDVANNNVLRGLGSKYDNLGDKLFAFAADGSMLAYKDFSDIRIVELQAVLENQRDSDKEPAEPLSSNQTESAKANKIGVEFSSKGFSTTEIEMSLGQLLEIVNLAPENLRIIAKNEKDEEIADVDLEKRSGRYAFTPKRIGVYTIWEIPYGKSAALTVRVR